jgi:propanol-preferring alcohol dehydrogenase
MANFPSSGSAGGVLGVRKPGVLAPGLSVSLPFWGARDELEQLVEMAERRLIRPEVTTYPLKDIDIAVDQLRHGKVAGRAVLLPHKD